METLDDARVHLAHSAFAQVECRADFLHRHLFVVVENNDQAFVAIETFGDQTHQVAFAGTARGILTAFVFEDIDFPDVFVAVGLVPFFVQRDESDGRSVDFHLFEFVDRDPHVIGEFVGRRSATVLGLKKFGRFVEFAGFAADESRDPVHRAQFVEHCASYTWDAVGFEFDPAFHIERIDRIHQAENPGADQVVEFDTFGKLRAKSFAVVANQRCVAFDELISKRDVGRIGFELYPDLGHISILKCGRCHPNLHVVFA